MKPNIQKIIIGYCWLCALITFTSVICLMGFVLFRGAPAFSWELFFGDVPPVQALFFRERVFDGIFPALVGTLMVVILSVSWAIPIGVAAGIYIAEFSGPKVRRSFDVSLDILASIPSIVIGLFGLTMAIFLHRYLSDKLFPCLLISSFALAILVLPYIVRTTQLALEGVPFSIRMAGLSMGASKLKNLRYVLFPQSISGILSGIILALGRSAEDTAVILLTGVVATAGIPGSILDKYEALPFYIYYISSQYTNQRELMSGFGAALILVLICIFLFISAHLLKNTLLRYISRV